MDRRPEQLAIPGSFPLCACGCGQTVSNPRRHYAGAACRARAYRRRRQGLPVDFHGGRRGRATLATLYRTSQQGTSDGAPEGAMAE